MTVTSREDIHNALRVQYGTLVEDAQGITTRYDNDPRETPGAEVLWTLFIINEGQSDQAQYGAQATYRHNGVATASIFAPIGSGTQASAQLAQQISEAFRARTLDGVRCLVPSVSRIGVRGAAFQINVDIPFYADEVV